MEIPAETKPSARRGRKKSPVSPPQAFSFEDQKVIMQFLTYIHSELEKERNVLEQMVSLEPNNPAPRNQLVVVEQKLKFCHYLSTRSGQKFRQRRLINGQLIAHYIEAE